MLEPIAVDRFRFTRAWLRSEAGRLANPKSPAYQFGRQLNLPPAYLLIHRVTLGSIGVLCQLESEASYRSIVERWLPGFAPEPPADETTLEQASPRKAPAKRATRPRKRVAEPAEEPTDGAAA
jgi:hypothetical protein